MAYLSHDKQAEMLATLRGPSTPEVEETSVVDDFRCRGARRAGQANLVANSPGGLRKEPGRLDGIRSWRAV